MLEKIGLPPKPSLRGNNWVVDATHCQGCSSHLTFINRKYHCRRCGGIFCCSCTQFRMVLRGQGDSPVRICEPCKKLEEAARFEMRHGHKSRAGRDCNIVPYQIMGRKDPAWKYGTEVPGVDKSHVYVECNFCKKICEGGITRLKNHLVGNHSSVDLCKKVPSEVKEELASYMKKSIDSKEERRRNEAEKIQIGSYYGGHPSLGGSSVGTASTRGVRGPVDRFVVDVDTGDDDATTKSTVFAKEARNAVCLDIGRFFFENGIPFNVADSPSFINMCRSIGNYGRGLKPPTPYELSSWILKEEEKTTKAFVEEVKKTWAHTGVSILSDGWKDIRGRQLINFLVNNPHGTVFLKSVDASDAVKDANLMFKLLDDVVDEVGEDFVIQVVTDNASNYKAAGRMLMEKRPRMWWTPCAAHCIDLMLEKLGELPQHKNALTKAKKVSNFIYNHGWVLALMRANTNKDLVRPAATRFATAYLTLQNMHSLRQPLEAMFTSREWANCAWAKKPEGREARKIILSDRNFWGSVGYAIKTTKPLVSVLRMANSEKVPGMGFLYGAMDNAKEEIAKNLDNEEGAYKEIWSIIDAKWDNQLRRHLHAAAYFLNPHFQYDDNFCVNVEVKVGLYACMDKLIPNSVEREKADLQLDAFRLRQGLFGYTNAKNTCKKRAPADWWIAFGDEAPELRNFAVKILSLTCSSSACERNWSTFNQIHTKRRNRLSASRLNSLAYIMYNKKLKDRHIKKKALTEEEDPLVVDIVPSDNEWVAGENDENISGKTCELDDIEEGEGTRGNERTVGGEKTNVREITLGGKGTRETRSKQGSQKRKRKTLQSKTKTKGGLKLTPKYEDEVLNEILGNDEQESASFGQETIIKMLSSSQRSSSSASCSNIQDAITHDERGEIVRSLSVGVTEMGSTTPDELRQQALDEKKYKTLKAEGKSEEALRAFKRGKELERQAGALDLQLRKSRRMASSSMNMNEISKTKDETGESRKINKHSPEMTKDRDDLAAELKSLGWSNLELRNAEKKPVSMSLEGELSSLLGEVSQKTNTKKVAHGSDKSQVIALKKNALALKREGKLVEAKEELKRAKILEKQIEEQANFNFDNLVDIADGLVVDNFEVTDEDMDDPEMTAALESLGWTEDTKDTADNEPQSVPINREILLAEIQSLKREALNQKRAGNTAEALTLLKKAKVIEGELGSYYFLGTNLNAHGSTIVQKDSLLHSTGMLKPNLVDVRKPDEGKDANPILAPKSKLMIQRELLALKNRALALRREGKLDEADEELKKGKALEQQLEDIDQTSKVKVTQVNNRFKDATTTAVLDVGDEEEDVTEQDMHDPSYNSLLRNLGWKDEENGNVQSPPKGNVNTSILTSESSVTRVHTGIQLGAPRSKGEIQRELLGLKRKSLALRRQGEAEAAEEVLEMAKLLEAQLSEMEAPTQEVTAEVNELQKDESNQSSVKNAVDDAGVAGFLLEDNAPRPSQNRSFTEDLGMFYKVTSEKRDEIVGLNENYSSTDESNSAQVMVSHNNQSSPQQKILAHKRRAVTLKREGKLVEAKEELRQAKILERSLEDNNSKPSTGYSDVSSFSNASIVQIDNSSISAPKLYCSRDRFKLQQESLSHKRQALKLCREGKTAEAEAEFELAKALETQLEELTANDPNKLSGSSAEPVDDVGVEDFLDPQLLSALKAIGLDDAPNVSGGSERPEPLKSVAGKIDNSSEDRIQREDRIKAEKVKAVNLKRLGKQAEAMDALRRAKMLEKKLNSLAL